MSAHSVLALALAVSFLAGCSSFDREWRADAGRQAGTVPSRWEGSWKSFKHKGAGGRLRCILTKADEKHYRAHFRADWLMFTSGYVAVLDAKPKRDGLHLSGAHHLKGIGGGLYRYDGQVDARQFRANYDSKYDTGIFEMEPARE